MNIDSIMHLLNERQDEIRELNIANLIFRGFEPIFIELAVKMGADIHADNDYALYMVRHRTCNCISILNIFKNAGMQFDTDIAAEALYKAIAEDEIVNNSYVEFLVDNNVNVHWHHNVIIKKAIERANRNPDDSRELDLLHKILNAR